MREILFRGKRVGSEEWVEGFYLTSPEFDNQEVAVITTDKPRNPYYVSKETIGQYTGLTDKNGTKIFEGDIIKYTRTNMYAPDCSFHKKDLVSIHLVLWDSSVSAFVQQHYSLNDKRIVGKGSAVLYDNRAKENIVEVIGNIHDNRELLKESK